MLYMFNFELERSIYEYIVMYYKQGCARLMSRVAADSNYSRPAPWPSAADTAGMRLLGQGQW